MLDEQSPLGKALVTTDRRRDGIYAVGILLTAAVLFEASITPAKADYHLQAGDTVEISVATVPELKQRVRIGPNGTISFPLLGQMTVAGLSGAEFQAKVQASLAAKAVRQRTPDGRESSVTIDPDEVTATVVEYRPVYINGDIAKPGEVAFRPLLTVRQAVALSGGYDIVRLRMNNPILESADLRGEYEALWTEFAKEQAHVWRLRQELGQDPRIDRNSLLDVPIPRSTALDIINVETDQLRTRQADAQAERTFLEHAITEADEQIRVLSEQQKTAEQANQADTEDFEKAKDLFSRGNITNIRVSDARRAMLLSSTQRLQTAAQFMQTQRQRDDYVRQLEKLDSLRKSEMLRELQDAVVSLSRIRSKLQSTGEKLQYVALAKSQLAGGVGSKPSITIIRTGAKGNEPVAADEDSALQPGDVIEVALHEAPATAPTDSASAFGSRQDRSLVQGAPKLGEYARQ
ncbi:polysaccharide biosynthesis/export family protein [Bradyrhizobium arachidis]|uniref:polysaccharide biosynthesis/export family protein n=1 Tax=Bradyrhizobium TaxID=374 RepID=UPI00216212F7|nr:MULTISPECIES: polysaccharide biosynthesis/export family protein [Bradyrhizobium]MDN4988571.1 polysaccharide biosynthesis/export family protein [Bradyrhizobium sp. WYCCWR 13022]UVO35198.1 polysaccharide biosynthesis/export family protein [Bradyrhizobium arachidis]